MPERGGSASYRRWEQPNLERQERRDDKADAPASLGGDAVGKPGCSWLGGESMARKGMTKNAVRENEGVIVGKGESCMNVTSRNGICC